MNELEDLRCPCQAATCDRSESTPEEAEGWNDFLMLRSSCPALRALVPDANLGHYRDWVTERDRSRHAPYAWLAFRRGCLGELTSPLHRYLLGSESASVTEDTWCALRDSYMAARPEGAGTDRHRVSRSFFGRWVELKAAEWLERDSWTVRGLAARGLRDADVLADSPSGKMFWIEIKYIGQSDLEHGSMVRLLHDEITWDRTCEPSDAEFAGYSCLRIFEASRQLRGKAQPHGVMLVYDAQARARERCFPMSLKGWLEYWCPRSQTIPGAEFGGFLDQLRAKHSDLMTDIRTAISGLDKIWALEIGSTLRPELLEAISDRERNIFFRPGR